jgi:hypothetical protein
MVGDMQIQEVDVASRLRFACRSRRLIISTGLNNMSHVGSWLAHNVPPGHRNSNLQLRRMMDMVLRFCESNLNPTPSESLA